MLPTKRISGNHLCKVRRRAFSSGATALSGCSYMQHQPIKDVESVRVVCLFTLNVNQLLTSNLNATIMIISCNVGSSSSSFHLVETCSCLTCRGLRPRPARQWLLGYLKGRNRALPDQHKGHILQGHPVRSQVQSSCLLRPTFIFPFFFSPVLPVFLLTWLILFRLSGLECPAENFICVNTFCPF